MTSGIAPPVRISLLGGFGLTMGARAVDLPPGCQRLLAFLALRGPGPRRTVAGMLWDDQPEARALASLRTTVWRLNREGVAVGAPGDPVLRLPEGTGVDLMDLSDRGTTSDLDLAGLSAVELLPGWYDEWVLVERERVRQRVLHHLEAQAERAIAVDPPTCAVDLALLVLGAGPLRESAHRLVIRAHLAEGDVVEARAHCRRAVSLLRNELGVAPSAHLQALMQGLDRVEGPATDRTLARAPAPLRSTQVEHVLTARRGR